MKRVVMYVKKNQDGTTTFPQVYGCVYTRDKKDVHQSEKSGDLW